MHTTLSIFRNRRKSVLHEIDKNIKMESNIDREKRNRFIKSIKKITSEGIIDKVIENRR